MVSHIQDDLVKKIMEFVTDVYLKHWNVGTKNQKKLLDIIKLMDDGRINFMKLLYDECLCREIETFFGGHSNDRFEIEV